MAAFAAPKAGGWAYGEILTSAQMNSFNTDFPFALNCRDGGSYTPSGNTSIQSAITKSFAINGCSFPSAASGGGILCTGNVTVTQALNSDSLSTGDTIAFGDVVLGETAANTLSIYATTTIFALLDIEEKTTAKQRVRSPKGLIQGGDAGVIYQYSPANYDLIYIPPGHAVSASTRWRISSGYVPMTGTQSGEIISFRHMGTGGSIDVQKPDGTLIATIGPLTSGNLMRVDVAYDPLVPGFVIVDQDWVL